MRKMMKMTQFINWLKEADPTDLNDNTDLGEYRAKYPFVIKYSDLIQRPLSLSMFIPCKDGEPIEKPEEGQFKKYIEPDSYEKRVDEYQKAVESVMFEGWAIGSNGFLVNEFGGCIGVRPLDKFNFLHKDGVPNWTTIEDLINDGFTLHPTESCKKLIGLT